jgi:hypothetical protein
VPDELQVYLVPLLTKLSWKYFGMDIHRKIPLGRTGRRQVDYFKINVREVYSDGVKWNKLGRNRKKIFLW